MMTKPRLSKWFWLLLLAGIFVRLVAAWAAPHPGIADSNHYFMLASNLAEGRGFVIDYIWQYHNPPPDVTHPIDYWMPLPAIWPAIGLVLAPDNLFAALVPSVIFGTLLGVLAYGIAAACHMDESIRLIAMAGVIFLPEFVLNAARTDTTLSYVFFAGVACVAFYRGMRGQGGALLFAGIFAGLAHLSRQDGILFAPAFVVSIAIYAYVQGWKAIAWRWIWLIPVGWVLVLAPWMWRNWQLYEVLLPSGASRTLFMTSFIDQFTYGRTLDLQHYLDWGMGNILGNIAFQATANLKMSYTLLGLGLPITVLLGLMSLWHHKQRDLALMLVLPLVLVLGLFTFYTFLTPFHTQGGSFKKSYMLVIPFLSVVGAWWVMHHMTPRWMVSGFALALMAFNLANAFDLVRLDFAAAARFDQSVLDLKPVLDAAGDVNGDGEIIIMTQDPYILNYHGYRALMIPSDPLEMILEAAYRYNVDYILLPPARDALNPFMDGQVTDPRLRWLPATSQYQLLEIVPKTSNGVP